jgi:hypothetical protein
MLPKDLEGKTRVVFESAPLTIPDKLPTLNRETVTGIINSIRDELNFKFLTELAAICIEDNDDDKVEDDSCRDQTSYVIVGASHAARLASKLDDLDLHVIDITIPGWKFTEKSVEAQVNALKEVLKEECAGETVIIYHLYDNSCYLGVDERGNCSLPEKSAVDKKYHIKGCLTMVGKAEFKELFLTSVPLLRAGGEHNKILLSPLARHVAFKCCKDKSHIQNYGGQRYTEMVTEGLQNIFDWMKKLAYFKRIRHFKVLCPNIMMQVEDDSEVTKHWGKDGVHLTDEGYEYLANNLLEQLEDVKFTRDEDKGLLPLHLASFQPRYKREKTWSPQTRWLPPGRTTLLLPSSREDVSSR